MSTADASRLCSGCGMCCNGVMFHRVRLQKREEHRVRKAFGSLTGWSQDKHSIVQPCPAHQGAGCGIYRDRPLRCREFVCALLQQVAAGNIAVDQAAKTIRQTQELVKDVRELLRRSGCDKEEQSFVSRYAWVLGQPLGRRSDPQSALLRKGLIDAFQRLEEVLTKSFRLHGERAVTPVEGG